MNNEEVRDLLLEKAPQNDAQLLDLSESDGHCLPLTIVAFVGREVFCMLGEVLIIEKKQLGNLSTGIAGSRFVGAGDTSIIQRDEHTIQKYVCNSETNSVLFISDNPNTSHLQTMWLQYGNKNDCTIQQCILGRTAFRSAFVEHHQFRTETLAKALNEFYVAFGSPRGYQKITCPMF